MIGDIIDEVLEVLNDTGNPNSVYPACMKPDLSRPIGVDNLDQSDEIGMMAINF